MRALIQRVDRAKITINSSEERSIAKGLVVLLGVEHEDGPGDIQWLSKKVAQLRIFDDEAGQMNLSVTDVSGEILVVSQFTLHASTKKGNRPSWIKAAPPEISEPMYESFVRALEEKCGKEIITGSFGAHMNIELVNNGPVTIFIDSKDKE